MNRCTHSKEIALAAWWGEDERGARVDVGSMAQRRIWSPKCLGGSSRHKEKRMNWRHMLEAESM